MQKDYPECAVCNVKVSNRLCRKEGGKAPSFCPTLNRTETIANAQKEYEKPGILEFAKQASIQEGEGYGQRELGYECVTPIKPRILETIEFSQKMKFERLGLVFCTGLHKEAMIVQKLISSRGFEVISAACKVGRVPKEAIGITENQKVSIGCFEAMCNPIAQAFLMNDEKTQFNIVMGLCVGHDSLFLKYANAPCTVLAAKDRVLAHNPLAALYNIDGYYRALKAVPVRKQK